MRATKTTSKIKTKLGKCFIYLPKLTVFFGNRQQSNARAGQKKYTCFFGNARPKSNARADLKQKIIVASKEDQYTYFLSIALKQTNAGFRSSGIPFLVFY